MHRRPAQGLDKPGPMIPNGTVPSRHHAFWIHLPKILNRSRTVPSLAVGDSPSQEVAMNEASSDKGPCNSEPSKTVLPETPSRRLDDSAAYQSENGLASDYSLRLTAHSPLVQHASKKLIRTAKSHGNLTDTSDCDQYNLHQCLSPNNVGPMLLPSPLPGSTGTAAQLNSSFSSQTLQHPYTRTPVSVQNGCVYDEIVAGYNSECLTTAQKDQSSVGATPVAATTTPCQQVQRKLASAPEHRRIKVDDHRESPATSPTSPLLRSPERERSRSLSSEATWMSKSFTHQSYSTFVGQLESIRLNERRLQETPRRWCHVFESVDDEPADVSPNGKTASYTTMTRPGKANKLWVACPHRSPSPSPATAVSSESSKAAEMPATPERSQPEVSAFSPWGTPEDNSPGTEITIKDMVRGDEEQPEAETHASWPCPTNSAYRRDHDLGTRSSSPRSMSESSFMSASSSARSLSTLTSHNSDHDQQITWLQDKRDAFTLGENASNMHEDLNSLLDSLEQVIEEYPSRLPGLDSAWTLSIRGPDSLDELHVDRLLKVFPNATRAQSSALAAMLIAESFLASQPVLQPRDDTAWTTNKPRAPASYPAFPECHFKQSTNPNSYSNRTPLKHKPGVQQPETQSVSTDHQPLNPCSHFSSLSRPIPDPPTASLFHQRQSPHHLAQSHHCSHNYSKDRLLRKRAKVIAVALHVTVQKLMIDICGRYDEVLLRALTCLVETVERGWQK